jgi:hypothetical protein
VPNRLCARIAATATGGKTCDTYRKFAGHWIVGFAHSSDWDNIKHFNAEWAAAKSSINWWQRRIANSTEAT